MKNKTLIFNEIIGSKKYKSIDKNLINRIIDEESPKYKKDKLIIKAVKNRLHQIHGAFITINANHKTKSLLLENKYDEILSLHTSTLERLPFYEEFYQKIFAITGIPTSILDIACGFNPFAIKYMKLPNNFQFYAYDINQESCDLLNSFFTQNKYQGIAKIMDLTTNVPEEPAEVGLILKFLALMTQQNNQETLELLKKLKVNYIVVSFPTKTLTGLNVGMMNNYKTKFNEIIKDNFSILSEIVFSNELVFIIKKS